MVELPNDDEIVIRARSKEPKRRISRRLGKEEYERLCRIYFIEAPALGLIKIGYTLRVPERFTAMLTMSPVPLSLLADMAGGPQQEAQLHDRFERDRAHGEWFHSSPELRAIIAAAETQYEPEYWHNKLATYRGEKLMQYLADLKAGKVTRATRGPNRHRTGT